MQVAPIHSLQGDGAAMVAPIDDGANQCQWWVTQRRRPLRAMQTDSGRNYWVQLKSEKEIAS
jgi:hypothetical protein